MRYQKPMTAKDFSEKRGVVIAGHGNTLVKELKRVADAGQLDGWMEGWGGWFEELCCILPDNGDWVTVPEVIGWCVRHPHWQGLRERYGRMGLELNMLPVALMSTRQEDFYFLSGAQYTPIAEG